MAGHGAGGQGARAVRRRRGGRAWPAAGRGTAVWIGPGAVQISGYIPKSTTGRVVSRADYELIKTGMVNIPCANSKREKWY